MKWTIFLDFVHYRIGTLWTNQKQCAIVHLENIVSTESFPAECPHLTLGVRYAYQPEKKNMRLVCCLIWLLPKALAAAVEKIRILKSGAWTLFWLKNALELENLRSLEKTQKGCWLAQTQNKSHEFFSNIFGKTAYFQQFIKG